METEQESQTPNEQEYVESQSMEETPIETTETPTIENPHVIDYSKERERIYLLRKQELIDFMTQFINKIPVKTLH